MPDRPVSLASFAELLTEKPFRAPVWLRHGHLQTLAGALAKRRFPWGGIDREEFFVDLSNGARVRAVGVWQARPAPTLVAIHGMGGSSASNYMLGLSHKAYREGWNAVLLDLYNRNRALPRPTIFHSGSSGEVGDILAKLAGKRGLREFLLVGVSMGGNILLKLLGEWGASAPVEVRAAAAVSPLVDLTVSWQLLERPSNLLFQHYFVRRLKELIKPHRQRLAPFVHFDALMQIRTVREFDELFTAPLGGFRDVFDYYQKASALPWLANIHIPTVVIHAQDDPLLPWEPLTRPHVCANSSLLVHLTPQGGHVGFAQRDEDSDRDRFWAENRAIDFFRMQTNSPSPFPCARQP